MVPDDDQGRPQLCQRTIKTSCSLPRDTCPFGRRKGGPRTTAAGSPRARRHATRLWQLTRRAAKPSRLPLTMKSFSWFPAARPHGQPAPSDALGAAEGGEHWRWVRRRGWAQRWAVRCALGRRLQGWAQRQTGRCPHGGGLVGQGRAPGVGSQHRAIRGRAAHRARTRARGAHTPLGISRGISHAWHPCSVPRPLLSQYLSQPKAGTSREH